jgi:hypothetical protein
MKSDRDYHTLLGINSERGNQLGYIFPGHKLIQQYKHSTKAKSDHPDESVLPHRRSLVMTQFFLVPTLCVGMHTGLTPLHEMESGRDYHTLLGINSERGNQLRYIFPGHRLIQQCMRATKANQIIPMNQFCLINIS